MKKVTVGIYVIIGLSILVASITLIAGLVFLLRQEMVKAVVYFILTLFWLIGLAINMKLLQEWNTISEKDSNYQDED
ncbi:Uncharacterised protein [Streptococcus dysgalactiae subsp. equisimilis]|uniref:Uncharacterized protein n=2 Tax=Streptococcus dysgalactiae TaxID=1334 RepID=A0AAE9U2U7_STREQ|nr:hypothetical protein [Streptococcus dysgalactiae]EGL49358.1 hypothetical protein HMPREF9964_1974 [Streptococcus dysgalactiae subsp. equisimilis SK1249]KKC17319.1 hypothetical protein WH81_06060 [Streptococcus dysgalactiae subsp. equisimilis]MBM6540766.1 hypothetical protein [Streptococcus dysgalactiae subsp. equisimilis]MCY7209029.1 hypothetical protein [Streptococcus dysgalactiae]MDQ0262576.1 hypothetical protein [Streptococcus dysgalactiae]